MAQITPQYAESLQKKHGFKFWKVYDRSRKEIDNNTRDISVNESAQLLQETLNNVSGDCCYITFMADETKKGGKQPERLDVSIKLHDGIVNPLKNSVNGIPISDFLSLQEKFFETKLELERARISEPPEPKMSAIDKLVNHLVEGNHIPTLISALLNIGKKAAPPVEEINAPDDLAETLRKFSKVDPTYTDTLKKMADYLEKNPAVLPQIKTIIGA